MMLGDMVRGAAAGAAATWLMDVVTTELLGRQSEATTAREEAARPNGKSALANLVDRLEATLGWCPTATQRSLLTEAIHYGLGMGPGALYAVMRRRVPLLGAGHGLLYGALLWAVNDEYINTKLGLAAPFAAYPAETHLRGLVGHLVLGVATHAGIDRLGGG